MGRSLRCAYSLLLPQPRAPSQRSAGGQPRNGMTTRAAPKCEEGRRWIPDVVGICHASKVDSLKRVPLRKPRASSWPMQLAFAWGCRLLPACFALCTLPCSRAELWSCLFLLLRNLTLQPHCSVEKSIIFSCNKYFLSSSFVPGMGVSVWVLRSIQRVRGGR